MRTTKNQRIKEAAKAIGEIVHGRGRWVNHRLPEGLEVQAYFSVLTARDCDKVRSLIADILAEVSK